MIRFELQAVCPVTGARAGLLHLPHGVVETPVFMPVGTRATVKAMAPWELEELGARIILSNTYHLHLRPGEELIARAGGLHAFMDWHRPILTDSGGFQVFSLATLRRVSEEGVEFRSHLDGSLQFLSPERAVEIQEALGSDVAMCFDECVALPATREATREAAERTVRWAERCLNRQSRPDQALFGIVQGGLCEDLRGECARALASMDFPGYAVGGLSVGESHEEMYRILDTLRDRLPDRKPRYLMGVGFPSNLVEGVARGVDMFDCVLPTRNGRNGTLLTREGRMNIKAAAYEEDFSPIDPECGCVACRRFTRAYIRHLHRSGEILAARLCTTHNLHFLIDLMGEMRRAILEGTFPEFRSEFMARFRGGEASR
jgi:queuine tRNA-ribosyltransferase